MAAQSCCSLARTCAQSLDVNVPSLRSTRRFSSAATLCTRTTAGSSKPACCHSTSSTSKLSGLFGWPPEQRRCLHLLYPRAPALDAVSLLPRRRKGTREGALRQTGSFDHSYLVVDSVGFAIAGEELLRGETSPYFLVFFLCRFTQQNDHPYHLVRWQEFRQSLREFESPLRCYFTRELICFHVTLLMPRATQPTPAGPYQAHPVCPGARKSPGRG